MLLIHLVSNHFCKVTGDACCCSARAVCPATSVASWDFDRLVSTSRRSVIHVIGYAVLVCLQNVAIHVVADVHRMLGRHLHPVERKLQGPPVRLAVADWLKARPLLCASGGRLSSDTEVSGQAVMRNGRP
jgi:hypothetical protein